MIRQSLLCRILACFVIYICFIWFPSEFVLLPEDRVTLELQVRQVPSIHSTVVIVAVSHVELLRRGRL